MVALTEPTGKDNKILEKDQPFPVGFTELTYSNYSSFQLYVHVHPALSFRRKLFKLFARLRCWGDCPC
jgi:hypothetical protein